MSRIRFSLDPSMSDKDIVAKIKGLAKGRDIRKRSAAVRISKSAFAPRVEISKTEADKNLVFGWASVAFTKDGRQLDDLQGHSIDLDDLEDAAYNFVINYRKTGEMHFGEDMGEMVESVVFTPEKLNQLGLEPDAVPLGWWVGFRVPPSVFAKVKSGVYKMFSIQGKATLEPIV